MWFPSCQWLLRWGRCPTEGVVESDERLPVHGFKNQPTPAAQHRPAITADVPGKARTRTEVLLIGVVEAADSVTHLHHANIRIEVSQQIVGFLRNRAVFVADAKIEGQSLAGAPVILRKSRIRPVVQMQSRVSDLDRRLEGQAGEEVFQRRGPRPGPDRNATQKRNAASGVAVSGVGHFVIVQFAAKLHRVLACGVRDLIDELSDGVWPLELRPFKPSQSREKITAKPNARQAAGEGSTYPRVQAVGGGRRVEISGQRR